MSRHLILDSPFRRTYWEDDGDKVNIVTENTSRYNKMFKAHAKMMRDEFERKGKYGEMQHVTSFMPSEIDIMKERGILGPNLQVIDEAALNRFIRDPDRRDLLSVPSTY